MNHAVDWARTLGGLFVVLAMIVAASQPGVTQGTSTTRTDFLRLIDRPRVPLAPEVSTLHNA